MPARNQRWSCSSFSRKSSHGGCIALVFFLSFSFLRCAPRVALAGGEQLTIKTSGTSNSQGSVRLLLPPECWDLTTFGIVWHYLISESLKHEA